jgi:hypothetical protein
VTASDRSEADIPGSPEMTRMTLSGQGRVRATKFMSLEDHSPLTLAALISGQHFSISAL